MLSRDNQPSGDSSEDFSSLCLGLAEQVISPDTMGIERRVISALDKIREILSKEIPGLKVAEGRLQGEELQSNADLALRSGDPKLALSHALTGLAHWPHSPTLMCTAGMACYELGQLPLALRLVDHAAWVNPSYLHAQHCRAKLLNEFRARFNKTPNLLTVQGR